MPRQYELINEIMRGMGWIPPSNKSLKKMFKALLSEAEIDSIGLTGKINPVILVKTRYIKPVVISATAGNATLALTVPMGEIWKPINGRITLVCDATVANRIFYLTKTVKTVVMGAVPSPTATAASGTGVIDLNDCDYYSSSAAASHLPLKNLIFEGGTTITLGVTAGVAGDSWSGGIEFEVECGFTE